MAFVLLLSFIDNPMRVYELESDPGVELRTGSKLRSLCSSTELNTLL